MDFPAAPPGHLSALLTRVDRSAYDVQLSTGPARVPSISTTDPLDAPTVGDWLVLTVVEPHVVDVLPRTSLLVRGTSGASSHGQPLAANVDYVLICMGLSGSLPLRRLERFVTLAWESGAQPVVVLTKSDLCDDLDTIFDTVRPHAPGCDVVAVSAANGDVGSLAPYASSTLVLLGASGAGKSTVVNSLVGGEVMETSEIRQVDGKGRHTTTHRELVLLPGGGMIIDTPGLRAVGLHATEESLSLAFSDVEDLATACRFADCAHRTEPGCAVLASVAAGDLAQDRVDSWRAMQRELAYQSRRTDARLRTEELRKWKAVTKAHRVPGGRR